MRDLMTRLDYINTNYSIRNNDEEKHAFRDKFDWDRMTQQDEDVWKIIFETLDK